MWVNCIKGMDVGDDNGNGDIDDNDDDNDDNEPLKGHIPLACSMVCKRNWHMPVNPKLVWHPARLIKEGRCLLLPCI